MGGNANKRQALKGAMAALAKRFLPKSASMAGRDDLKELGQAPTAAKRSERFKEITMIAADMSELEKINRRMEDIDSRIKMLLCAKLDAFNDALERQADAMRIGAALKNRGRKNQRGRLSWE